MAPYKIFVISLKRAASRRAACAKSLGDIGLKFEFFDAIDGDEIGSDVIESVYDNKKNFGQFKRPLSRREVACYLSHYTLWRRIVDEGLEGAVILEDDFETDRQLREVLYHIEKRRLSNAFIKLHTGRRVVGETIAQFPDGHRLIFPKRVPGLALGYVVDRVAAEKLVRTALPFGRPVDMDLKYWWEFGVPVLVVDPPPLRLGAFSSVSYIGGERDKIVESQLSPNRFFNNILYQIRYNIELRRARRLRRHFLQSMRNLETPSKNQAA